MIESECMNNLDSSQKKYLRGLAHKLKPVAFVGQKGLTNTLILSIDEALAFHELIKVKFVEFREKEKKIEMTETIVKRTGSAMVGMIGHTAILYRPGPDPKQRKIRVPGVKGEILK